jgi:hypothetical protein
MLKRIVLLLVLLGLLLSAWPVSAGGGSYPDVVVTSFQLIYGSAGVINQKGVIVRITDYDYKNVCYALDGKLAESLTCVHIPEMER